MLRDIAQGSGPETIDPEVTSASSAIKTLFGGVLAVSLRYSGGKWQYCVNNGLGTWVDCTSQDYYVPPFYVRAINLCDASNANRTIQYDCSGNCETAKTPNDYSYQVGIVEILATNMRHAEHITRIVFAGTTATSIILHG